MSKLKIKTAQPGDAALIADISRETFYDTFAPFNTKEDMDKFMAEQFTRESLMREVEQAENIFLLLMDEEHPLGYLKLKKRADLEEFPGTPAAELARIYIRQSGQGKGGGKILMQAAIDLALSLNARLLWLGVWEKNEKAIRFYRQWGFEKFGEHTFLLGNDKQTDWLLAKRL